MAIDLDVVTRLNKATAREAAREAQAYFKDAGKDAGDDFGDGLAKGITSKVPEVEKALKKVQDASGKVIVEQEKLNALKAKSTTTDSQLIVQSEKLAKAHRAEESAVRDVNRALDDHNSKADNAVVKTRNLGDEAEKAAKKIGGLGVSFKGLGAVGLLGTLPAVATGITEVAGALQQLSGAALAGPGIFAGIAASAGTAALGMQGMSDAFTASIKALDGTKASVEAANKALAALSPNAADAVKTVVGLKGTFTELRDIASQNIFQGFSGNLKNLVSADLPVLTRGIDGISKGLNQNLTEVMRSLGSSSSQGFLDRILGNTGDAQSRLTGAIDPIVHAVGVLTAAGSDTLPRLADAVGKVADRFDQFISTADANGNLKKWIDEGITGFTQFGNTVLNIGKVFTDLTAAAGGGQGLLGTLESATGRLHDFLSSTQGQSQLRDYFTQGRDMLAQLLDLAQQAGPVLGGMFQAAASLTRSWLPVITQILDIINSIPGGAEAVVGAFVAWQSIKGIAAVATGLNGIVNVLKFVMPGAAAEGAAGISAALAGITLPAWLSSFIAAGGSIAALPLTAGAFITGADAYYTSHDHSGDPENARARGVQARADAIRNGGSADPNAVNAPGWGGGGGSFGPGPAPGYGASADPSWTPFGPATAGGRKTYRTRDGSIRDIPGQGGSAPANTPGVSGYSDPVVTDPGGKGKDTPYIDPAKFAVGNPLAGMPAPSSLADPQAVYEADSRALTAANNLSQGKLALAVLEAKGTATQQELLTAKNNIQEQERALYDAQFKDLEARQGKMAKASSDLQSIFAPLDQDFGVSGGIPGIVKNLVTFLGNMALGGAIASSPQLQAAALQMQSPQGAAASPGAMFAPGGQMMTGGFSSGVVGTPGAPYGMPAGTNSGGYGGGGAQFPDWVNQVASTFGLKPSTYPGHQESDRHEAGYAPNPEHENRGIDWSGPVDAMQRFADYLATIPGALEQVIWKNPNTGQTDTIAGGKPVSGYYDAATLAEHENHVHTRQSAGIPLPGGYPSALGPPPQWSADWNAMAQKESSGNWGINTGNGYSGGLQFSPSSWSGAGGNQYAPSAAQASPYQQAMTAEQLLAMQGPGAWPNTFTPGNAGPLPPGQGAGPAPGGWGAGGLPSLPAGQGGQGFMGSPQGMAGQGVAAAPGTASMSQAASGGGGGGGVGMTPGGSLDSALSGAAAAADLFAPGAGQAAQVGIKLANRAIQYGGQAAAIGVSGLMETFLPHNSELGDPGKSWIGKIAGGIAAAKPAGPNQAGKPQDPQQKQGNQTDQGQQHNGPMVNIENMHNNGADGQGVGNDIARQQYSSYSAGGPR